MVILISYFNSFVDEDYLTRITKCKVLSKCPCMSSEIRLRRIKNYITTFSTKDFYSNETDFSFGMFYMLEIEDLEVFSMFHSQDLYLKEINISTIDVESVDKFMKKDYKVVEHNVKSLCFVAKNNEVNKTRFKNRKTKVNLNKRLLLNFLKI